MTGAERLAKLVYEKGGFPAINPYYSRTGISPQWLKGWYYQPGNQLGAWVFLGKNVQEAEEKIKTLI